jgi:hypothetical protein
MVKFVSADGRAFTNYFPNDQVNRNLQQQAGVTNTYNYRMWLQRNATSIMGQDRHHAALRNKLTCNCPSCISIASIQN